MYYAIAVLVALALFICSIRWESGFCGAMGVIIMCVTGMTACQNSDYEKNRKAEERARDIADAKPRPFSQSADGCTVYTFRTDRWRYFTRCTNQTTTDNDYKESCGKNCTKVVNDDITMENTK